MLLASLNSTSLIIAMLMANSAAILTDAFLGYNPLQSLLGPHVIQSSQSQQAATLVSKDFFPYLIAGPLHSGLVLVFAFSFVMCMVAALASWLHGGHDVYRECGAALNAIDTTSIDG